MMAQTAVLKRIFLLVLLVPAFATSAYAAETFEENLTAPGTISLEVSTGSGSISVTTGSGREISVIGTVKPQRNGWFNSKSSGSEEALKAVLANPPVELEGDVLVVGKLDRSIRKKVSISYEIVVPADTKIAASSGSGSVAVSDTTAPAKASTGSGSIKLQNIGGSAVASTGSGAISAEGIAGSFKGSTGSGSISLTQTAPGDVKATTGSGRIKLSGVVGALKANSGSGSITVDGQQEGDWKLNAGSGSISVTLPDDAAFNLDADSRSGGVRIADHFEVEGKTSKKHVKGTVNGGGHELRIDTGSGGIKVL